MRSKRLTSAAACGALFLAVFASLGGCNVSQSLDVAHCPPEGTTLTYETFGQRFFAGECNQCHGRHATERHGAPGGYFFDTHEDVVQWKDRIYERSAGTNDSMPPGPNDPPAAERKKLAEWLACGAP